MSFSCFPLTRSLSLSHHHNDVVVSHILPSRVIFKRRRRHVSHILCSHSQSFSQRLTTCCGIPAKHRSISRRSNMPLSTSGAGSGMAGRAAAIPIRDAAISLVLIPKTRYSITFFILLLYQLLLLIDILIQHSLLTYLLT